MFRVCSIACFPVPASAWRCLADAKITFLDVGQGDGTVLQIAQPAGEPFSMSMAGMETVISRKTNRLLSQDPTIELVVLSPPHKDHTREII
jgi:beta-lactamase superfamily II metal-dependent hydrolase